MTDLTIAYDPGSTSSRAFHTLKPFKPELLLMESEVAEVSPRSVKVYEANRLGNPAPENAAWIECKGEYRAVGFLAKNHFWADLNLADSKLKLATWKALALIGAIASKNGLPNGSTIRFGALLPYGEYQDRELFEQFLTSAIGGYRFRGEERSFELESFVCRPEGFGLVSRGRGPGASLKEQIIVIVIVGFRDVSIYVMNRGVITRGISKDIGFSKFVETVQAQTAGLKMDVLTAAICKAGPKISARALAHLGRNLDPSLRDAEVTQIRTAIAVAREQYWLMLSNWLRHHIPAQSDEAIIGGGTAYYYEREFTTFFSGVKLNWCAELEEQINRCYMPQVSQHSLSYRLTDVYGFFNYLVGSERPTAHV
ncbi:FIG00873374: hypothetical protein [uncultured Leptolyngbya sp.]|uniref:Actin-like protein N-terminal domain-containing protein n=1 Tax=uncultured Leptolyngbya sp. TaxID=332963 RepID=A0A6J4MKQ0_9CYAN|nr:FIG00873374: hypothetical protein [uncultured Leptolyngbya sp.]